MNNRGELFEKIWWEDLNGPRRFLGEAAEKLSCGKSIVLCLPNRVPFEKSMRDVLEKLLLKGTQSIKVVDAEKISSEPQEYVLKEFCDDKDGFRPFNKGAYAEFLAKRTGIALNSSCIWIRNASPAQVEKWFSFIADYQNFLAGNYCKVGRRDSFLRGQNQRLRQFRVQYFCGGGLRQQKSSHETISCRIGFRVD